MKYKRICILDLETTSVYVTSAAPVQIAAIICDEHGNIIDSFNEKIKTTHKTGGFLQSKYFYFI